MSKIRHSANRNVLKEIVSKSRTAHLPPETRYMVIFAFVYKYCSDSLKRHLLSLTEDR